MKFDFHGKFTALLPHPSLSLTPKLHKMHVLLAWLQEVTLVYSCFLKKLQNCVLRELFIVTITELTDVNVTDKLYLVK